MFVGFEKLFCGKQLLAGFGLFVLVVEQYAQRKLYVGLHLRHYSRRNLIFQNLLKFIAFALVGGIELLPHLVDGTGLVAVDIYYFLYVVLIFVGAEFQVANHHIAKVVILSGMEFLGFLQEIWYSCRSWVFLPKMLYILIFSEISDSTG